MAVVITQTANPNGAGTGTAITYSGLSIGAAAADRLIILAVGSEVASASPNSATIDFGGGAQTMTAGSLGNFGAVYARLFYFPVPTGTTAEFVITFGASVGATSHHVAVYKVTGAIATPLATNNSNSTDWQDVATTTGAITIPTNGGFFGVAAGAADTTAKTWNNATADLDADVGTFRFTTATRVTALTATAITQTGANNEDAALSWITFETNTIEGVGTAKGRSDTSLLVHFDGSDGSTTFTDATGKHTLARNESGDAQIDTAQSKFGGSSGLFSGTLFSYVNVADNLADFNFGTGDYSVDMWVRPASAPGTIETFLKLDGATAFTHIQRQADGKLCGESGPGVLVTGTTTLAQNTWYHIALVRSGGTSTLYVNGVSEGTPVSDSVNITAVTTLHIGDNSNSTFTNGWIDELRIIRDHAAFTKNFSVPTSAYETIVTKAIGEQAAGGSVASATGTGASSIIGASINAADGAATGIGAASADGAQIAAADGAASGTGSSSVVGTAITPAEASASGTGDSSVVGSFIQVVEGQGQASGTGAASADGAQIAAADASASGAGASSVTAEEIRGVIAEASGTGAASADGAQIAAAEASATGIGSSNVVGSTASNIVEADGSASGTGAASAAGEQTAEATASASGTGDATAISEQGAAVASASGDGAASATGAQIAAAEASATGTGASSVVATEIREATASASGTGASSVTGAQVAAATAAASGTGDATGISEQGAAVGSATGTGAASATGNSIAAAAASATGTGAGSGSSAAIKAATADASGTGSASASSSATQTVEATAAATGTGSADAGGTRIESAAGAASGTGATSGVGEADTGIRDAIGSAAGTGTAAAVSSFLTRRITTSTWVACTWPSRPAADQPKRSMPAKATRCNTR